MLLKKLALNRVGALNLIFVKMGGFASQLKLAQAIDKGSGYMYVSSFIIIAPKK